MLDDSKRTDIEDYKKKMKQYGYNEVEKQQAVDDLNSGLTTSQVEKYLGKGFELKQMRVMSACMKKEYSDEVINVICNPTFDGFQMEVALEFYEKGIPIDQIAAFSDGKNDSVTMRKTYQKTLFEMQKLNNSKEEQPEYVAKLVESIDAVVKRIEATDEKYNLLVEKVANSGKEDKEVLEGLLKNLKDKDEQIADLAKQIESAREESESLKATIKKLKKEKEEMESKKEDVVKEMEKPVQTPVTMYYGMPVGYENIIRSGGQVHMIPIEKSTKKSSMGVLKFATALGFKKKYKQDLVKLIADKNLSPEQLVCLRVALQKGLTEGQMMELINNKVPADQMREIIEFAVLENSMKE